MEFTGREARWVAWGSLAVGLLALVAPAFQQEAQTMLCRAGLRQACNKEKMTVESVAFHHQWMPRSADAVLMTDAWAGEVAVDEQAPHPIACDEPEDSVAATHESNFRKANPPPGNGAEPDLIRGPEHYVRAELTLAYPAADKPMDVDVDLSFREPPATAEASPLGPEAAIWPDFGKIQGRQHMVLQTVAGTSNCTVTFLVVPFAGRAGLSTERWIPGKYKVDITVRGGVEADKRTEFEIK